MLCCCCQLTRIWSKQLLFWSIFRPLSIPWSCVLLDFLPDDAELAELQVVYRLPNAVIPLCRDLEESIPITYCSLGMSALGMCYNGHFTTFWVFTVDMLCKIRLQSSVAFVYFIMKSGCQPMVIQFPLSCQNLSQFLFWLNVNDECVIMMSE